MSAMLVLSSTDSLVRDLIDALKADAATGSKAMAGVQSMVEGALCVTMLDGNVIYLTEK